MSVDDFVRLCDTRGWSWQIESDFNDTLEVEDSGRLIGVDRRYHIVLHTDGVTITADFAPTLDDAIRRVLTAAGDG